MKKSVKVAAFAAAAAGGFALLLKKMAEKREWEQWDEETIELSMTAGDMGETGENAAGAVDEKAGEHGGEPETVRERAFGEEAGSEKAETHSDESEAVGGRLREEEPRQEWLWGKRRREELRELSVVSVLPSGPKTARVRPTEEEETELLRKKLEKIIRF